MSYIVEQIYVLTGKKSKSLFIVILFSGPLRMVMCGITIAVSIFVVLSHFDDMVGCLLQ